MILLILLTFSVHDVWILWGENIDVGHFCRSKRVKVTTGWVGLLFVPLTFKSVDEIQWCYHLNEFCLAVLSHGTKDFVKYVVLTFESVDEILWCDHSNETSSAVLSHGTILFSM